MIVSKEIAKGQFDQHLFGQVNVAASQSAVALTTAAVSGEVTSVAAPFDGALVSQSYSLSVAGTAGVFTIAPTINGTAQTTLQQTVGTTTKGTKTASREAVKVKAGDLLGVKITTDGSWDGTTADLAVLVGVVYALQGI